MEKFLKSSLNTLICFIIITGLWWLIVITIGNDILRIPLGLEGGLYLFFFWKPFLAGLFTTQLIINFTINLKKMTAANKILLSYFVPCFISLAILLFTQPIETGTMFILELINKIK